MALQWGMGVLERKTELHCNGRQECGSRRLSDVAMGDIGCWKERLGHVAMADKTRVLQWDSGDRVALQWGMRVLEQETKLHCNGR